MTDQQKRTGDGVIGILERTHGRKAWHLRNGIKKKRRRWRTRKKSYHPCGGESRKANCDGEGAGASSLEKKVSPIKKAAKKKKKKKNASQKSFPSGRER